MNCGNIWKKQRFTRNVRSALSLVYITEVYEDRGHWGWGERRYTCVMDDQYIGHSCSSKAIMGVQGVEPLEALAI